MPARSRRDPRPTSDPLKTMADELADLRKRVAQLENGATSSGAVVRSKAMLVKSGAAIHFQNVGGDTMFFLGQMDGYDLADGSPQTGLILRRADGTLVMSVADPYPTVDGFLQYWGLYDRGENLIFGDDTTSGQGLASPWLDLPLYPSQVASYKSTTSSTFESVFETFHSKQHPKILVALLVAADAGTTGQVRLVVNGTQAAISTVDDGSWDYHVMGPVDVPGDFVDLVHVDVQARRTGGSGTISLTPSYARAVQS